MCRGVRLQYIKINQGKVSVAFHSSDLHIVANYDWREIMFIFIIAKIFIDITLSAGHGLPLTRWGAFA